MGNHSRQDSNSRAQSTAYGLPRRKRERGFTLLELVMVMTIIVILAAIGVASYQKIQQKAKETVLKEDLRQMRKLIDDFAADKERLPSGVQDLVDAGYMREVPVDPITQKAEWEEVQGEDTVSLKGGQGMIDVKSKAPGYEDY
ncbi:MAG TPA: type II secretion system protein [Blastocatellia bacterium]|nr:type II secretion system protein [Blastocatellia bacterium]